MDFRLYLITDRSLVQDLPEAVARALSGVPRGGAAVQLREKDLPARQLLDLALRLLPICRAHGAPLLINDRADIALASSADGVHLAGGSLPVERVRALLGPGRLIGASCHDEAQLQERAGADFATWSPIFATPGKGAAVGLPALARAAAAAPSLPLFALGGVGPSEIPGCMANGASGVAAIRAWLAAGDPAEAAAALYEAADRGFEAPSVDSTGPGSRSG